jgi:hypothetical protein
MKEMQEVWTVTQVDWTQYEYCVTAHATREEGIEVMRQIVNNRISNGHTVESIDLTGLICGSGWEARLEPHQGEVCAAIHDYQEVSNG